MSSRDPRLAGVKIFWSKGKQYAYFRPAHARIYAAPYTPEFFREIEAVNDNFKLTRPTTVPPAIKRRPKK